MKEKGVTQGSNRRGAEFEALIGMLLRLLQNQHPKVVRVLRHPKIELNNGTYVEADFELICDLPHQIDHRIIECQDRQRSSQEVVRKIRDIKAQSSKNRFILIFREEDFLSESVRKALKADGIVYYSLIGFASFLNQLSSTLGAVATAFRVRDFVEAAQVFESFPLLDGLTEILRPELEIGSRSALEDAIKQQPKQSDQAMLASPERRFRW